MIIEKDILEKVAKEMANDPRRAAIQVQSFIKSESQIRRLMATLMMTMQIMGGKELNHKETDALTIALSNFSYTIFRCFLEASNLEIKNKEGIKK